MNEDTNNDLFGIRLNGTGIHYIRKMASLAIVIYILVGVGSLFSFISAIRNIYKLFSFSSGSDSWREYSAKIITCVWCFSIILNLFGIHYYVKFLRSLRKSVDENNEPSFNLSFRYMYVNTIIFTWLMIMNIFLEAFGVIYFLFD